METDFAFSEKNSRGNLSVLPPASKYMPFSYENIAHWQVLTIGGRCCILGIDENLAVGYASFLVSSFVIRQCTC